jgi:simple sugar transport system substrate-binding protein
MSKSIVLSAAVALAGVVVAVLPSGGLAQDRGALHLTFITTDRGHAAATMAAGARQAAADLGVTLGYDALRTVDPTRVGERIAAAVAEGPDGLVIAVDDVEAVGAPIEAAAALGIPVVSVGVDRDAPRTPGVLLQVGSDETQAGIAAGRQLGDLGVANALCLQVDVGEPWASRCAGAASGLAASGGSMSVLTAIDPAGDPSGPRGAVAARLLADPSIDGILITDPASTSQTLGAITAVGRDDSLTLATFEVGADALDALEAGEMAFAVDPQPFLQGYLAVMSLALYAQEGLLVGGGEPLRTGLAMVTQQDAARVRDLLEQGVR